MNICEIRVNDFVRTPRGELGKVLCVDEYWRNPGWAMVTVGLAWGQRAKLHAWELNRVDSGKVAL